jgi:hypothetical protein
MTPCSNVSQLVLAASLSDAAATGAARFALARSPSRSATAPARPALGENDALVERIEAVKIHRIRSGATKRERAQIEVVDAPPILGGIMRDPSANERHRIDAAKALDAFAANGPETRPASDRFQITINLGADVLHFDKSIAIDANDVDPFNDADLTGVIAAIAAKKKDDGGDEPL